MKKRDVRKLLRLNPEFKSWLLKDSIRVVDVRSNPEAARMLYKKWQSEVARKQLIDFKNITEKTKKATDMLNSVHSFMAKMVEQDKKA